MNDKERKITIWADTFVIFAIVFHMGAVAATNAMVMKNQPEKQVKEANPIQAKASNLQEHQVLEEKPTFFDKILMFVKMIGWNFLAYAILTGYYVYLRFNKPKWRVFQLASIVLVIWGINFFNDFGYLLGMIAR